VAGSEFTLDLDTLIVAISEDSGKDCMSAAKSADIETTGWNTIKADKNTLATNRPGVFAAGDVITGPNTVIEAIANGKTAALMIDRFLHKRDLVQEITPTRPTVYVEPVEIDHEDMEDAKRIETPRAPSEWRRRNFSEVEVSFSSEEACFEAKRCLRCDLEFTKPEPEKTVPDDTKVVEEIVHA
jgi:NADPH-dependent glutamate synthase beta subunit-like oxidoreductase